MIEHSNASLFKNAKTLTGAEGLLAGCHLERVISGEISVTHRETATPPVQF
jgi:hypothetical protein